MGVGAAAGVPGYDKCRSIFGIFLIYSLGALSAFKSVSLAGCARQQPSCHYGCTGGTSASASTRIAPHWTSQRQPAHNDDAPARRHRARRSLGRARTRRTSAECTTARESCTFARLARTPVSASLPASTTPRHAEGQHDSPVTCAPVGGQHAAQCMAACPPPPRGAVGVQGVAVPRPSTPSCARTSNCRTECTSHSPASS